MLSEYEKCGDSRIIINRETIMKLECTRNLLDYLGVKPGNTLPLSEKVPQDYDITHGTGTGEAPRQQHLLFVFPKDIKQYLRIQSSLEHHLLFAEPPVFHFRPVLPFILPRTLVSR